MSLRRFALIAVTLGMTALATGGCTNTPTSKIAVGVIAYVRPGDPLFQMLLDPAVEAPEYVVVNMDHGDGDMRPMDSVADFLHLRTTRDGKRVKVFGYVWTSVIDQPEAGGDWTKYDFSKRPEADIRSAIDRWMVRPDGIVHYDGIFFDIASHVEPHRDKFLRLRDYIKGRWPSALIVHNSGQAVHSAYLEPGKQTADMFGTFEGDEASYFRTAQGQGGYWIGGNVNHNRTYVDGDTITYPNGVTATIPPGTFWHMVYGGTPGREQETVDLLRKRKAGVLTISTAPGGQGRNQWIKGPGEPAHLQALLRAANAPATTPVG